MTVQIARDDPVVHVHPQHPNFAAVHPCPSTSYSHRFRTYDGRQCAQRSLWSFRPRSFTPPPWKRTGTPHACQTSGKAKLLNSSPRGLCVSFTSSPPRSDESASSNIGNSSLWLREPGTSLPRFVYEFLGHRPFGFICLTYTK